jgi:hypothetical protein
MVNEEKTTGKPHKDNNQWNNNIIYLRVGGITPNADKNKTRISTKTLHFRTKKNTNKIETFSPYSHIVTHRQNTNACLDRGFFPSMSKIIDFHLNYKQR